MGAKILIQNGLLYDGTGAPPSESDILIENGKIARIAPHGTIKAGSAKKINAKGMWVTPGFLDTHTHYDAELALAPGLAESVRHGVTSIVVGSCSVSFVSSTPEDCSDMFTRVEAVPREIVLPLLKKTKKNGTHPKVTAHGLINILWAPMSRVSSATATCAQARWGFIVRCRGKNQQQRSRRRCRPLYTKRSTAVFWV